MAEPMHRQGHVEQSDSGAMTRSDYQAEKRRARNNERQAQFEAEYEQQQDEAAQRATVGTKATAGHMEDTSSASLRNVHAGSTIVGLMAWSAMFALVGNEINTVQAGKGVSGAAKDVTTPITEGGKIIIGGTVGTAFLLMLSHAGTGGQELATGLALITAVSSMIIWGKPVFGLLSNTFSSKPTTPISTSLNTVPTVGTSATSGAIK